MRVSVILFKRGYIYIYELDVYQTHRMPKMMCAQSEKIFLLNHMLPQMMILLFFFTFARSFFVHLIAYHHYHRYDYMVCV